MAPFRHIYPFTSRYADVNGFRMHYVDEGRGEPGIMLHGNPTWSFYFRELIQGLSGRYRAVAPDHIGCGLSDTPRPCAYAYRLTNRVDDLEALLAHLGLTRDITLVLHDWGGMIGAAYALRDVRRIARLIVLNTALMTASSPLTLRETRAHPELWGRLVESAVGAHLMNASVGGALEVFYWREGDREVDFILRHTSGRSGDNNPARSQRRVLLRRCDGLHTW